MDHPANARVTTSTSFQRRFGAKAAPEHWQHHSRTSAHQRMHHRNSAAPAARCPPVGQPGDSAPSGLRKRANLPYSCQISGKVPARLAAIAKISFPSAQDCFRFRHHCGAPGIAASPSLPIINRSCRTGPPRAASRCRAEIRAWLRNNERHHSFPKQDQFRRHSGTIRPDRLCTNHLQT
ncbi:hypothetical protein SDC9_39025 [bioreactor metagenome]|uniref:Uncharacterized protein n=1 Tax=bioreactor metagenome TaxID=1076179 RepID=A0A644VNG1_9ZZZZ